MKANILIGFTIMLATSMGVVSCKDKTTKSEEELSGRIEQQQDIVKVKAVKAKSGAFETEIASNGKAEANKKAVLKFKSGETILKVNVENGQRVKKGDIITELDPEKQQTALASASESYEKAKKLIRYFRNHRKEATYSFLGAYAMPLKLPLKRMNKFTCSQFVAFVLHYSGACKLPKDPYLMMPDDFAKLDNVTLVYEGLLKDCKV